MSNNKTKLLTFVMVVGTITLFNFKTVLAADETKVNYYNNDIYTKSNVINTTDEENYLSEKENTIQINNENYVFENYTKQDVAPSFKNQKYVSDTKILTSNSKSYLEKNFDNTYEYDDNDYAGTLNLINFNIETINNGYTEKINEIVKEQKGIKKYNDLAEINKNIKENGRDYVLINVEWLPETTENKAGTDVITTYTAKCHYQTVIRTYRPNTYKVSANYAGTVTKKSEMGKENILLNYKKEPEPVPEKKDNTAIKILLSLAGGLFVLFGLYLLFKPNAKILEVNYNGKPKKIKSFKIKKDKKVVIKGKQSNEYILKMTEKTFEKVNGYKIFIAKNGKMKELYISNKTISFKL